MRKFLLMSKVTLFCLLCSFSLKSFSHTLAMNTVRVKDKARVPSIGKFMDVPVKGRVTGEDGAGLPGVSVVVDGTTIGTVTDVDGNYSINVPNENSVLAFSFIGYVTEKVTVGTKSTIDINLALDVASLSEVVVTGYQTQNRREITGAVATVASKDLVAIPQGNVEQQLQGKVSGVTVISSGVPGTQSMVRIRGFGSFASNAPLYIVDGVPTFDISWLNSNDVETTTVLKDAASASIYGARAAAGVIVLTTKKGKSGKFSVSYDGSFGTAVPGKTYDLLSPTETMEATRRALMRTADGDITKLDHPQYGQDGDWELPDYIKAGSLTGIRNSDLTSPRPGYEGAAAAVDPANEDFKDPVQGPNYQIVKANKAGTNWFKEVTDPGIVQNHSLGLSGGTESSKVYFGLGQYENKGIVKNTHFTRTTIRLNTEFNIKNRVRFGENMTMAYRTTLGFGNLNESNPLSMSYRMNPLIPVRDIAGAWAGTNASGFNNPANPVAAQDRVRNNKNQNLDLFGNVYGEIDLLKGLTFRSSFGGIMSNFNNRGVNYHTYENAENVGNNVVFENMSNSMSWTFTNTLSFKRELGLHNINALVGVEAVKNNFGRNVGGTGQNPFLTDPGYASVSTALPTNRSVYSNGNNPTKLYSIFGKVDYTFNQKYLLSATVRRDGSSNFAKDHRFGIFPAVSAGWMISEEGFLKDISFIDNFKIRAGWGKMGNQNIPLVNQYDAFSPNYQTSAYPIDGANASFSPGFQQVNIGNPSTKWETSTTINAGFDGTFLNGTLDIAFDWYKKKTEDLLFPVPLPPTIAYQISPNVNLASMQNSGIDLGITKRGTIISDLTYSVEGNITAYKNKITSIAPGVNYFSNSLNGGGIGSGRISGGFVRNAVDQPISSFYGYKVVGLFQSAEDVANSPTQEEAAPGRFKFEDINHDGVISADDRTFFGNPNPDFTYGLTIKLGYKGVEFETSFYGSQGNDIINYTKWFTNFYPSFPGAALGHDALYDSWSETNTGAKTPRLENASNFSTNQQPNSYYMENGSYLRNRNMQLGYNLPQSFVNKIGLDRFKVYVQALNLFTITKYSGLDPGVSGVDTNFGIDYGNYPVVRTYLIGVSLGL